MTISTLPPYQKKNWRNVSLFVFLTAIASLLVFPLLIFLFNLSVDFWNPFVDRSTMAHDSFIPRDNFPLVMLGILLLLSTLPLFVMISLKLLTETLISPDHMILKQVINAISIYLLAADVVSNSASFYALTFPEDVATIQWLMRLNLFWYSMWWTTTGILIFLIGSGCRGNCPSWVSYGMSISGGIAIICGLFLSDPNSFISKFNLQIPFTLMGLLLPAIFMFLVTQPTPTSELDPI